MITVVISITHGNRLQVVGFSGRRTADGFPCKGNRQSSVQLLERSPAKSVAARLVMLESFSFRVISYTMQRSTARARAACCYHTGNMETQTLFCVFATFIKQCKTWETAPVVSIVIITYQ